MQELFTTERVQAAAVQRGKWWVRLKKRRCGNGAREAKKEVGEAVCRFREKWPISSIGPRQLCSKFNFNLQRMKSIVLTVAASLGLLLQSFGAIIYVNQSASGSNDGSSWANAYTNLSTALQAAANNSAAVDSLFIAEGLYFPDVDTSVGYATFSCPPEAALFGGFPSTGNPTLSDRDWFAHPTILEGDISQDDDGTTATRVDNAKRVVRMDTYGHVDGLVIRNGGDDSGAVGAGISLAGANARQILVENCLFENNWVTDAGALSGQGGAIRGLAINITDVAEVRNVAFINNKAKFGGAFIYSGVGEVHNCIFMGNESELGSAIAISPTGSGVNGAGTVTNSVFYNNNTLGGTNQGDRSGLIGRMNSGVGELTLWNCTFKDNQADSVSTIYGGIPLPGAVVTTFNNCLFDEGSTLPAFGMTTSDLVTLNNCVGTFAEGWSANGTETINDGTLTLNSWQEGAAITYSVENTADAIFVLDCDVPGHNDGLANSMLPASIANGTDLIGNTRVQGGTVDVGAYESAAFEQPTIQQQGNEMQVTNGPYDNYQWLLNGSVLAGANNPTFNTVGNGNYVLVASNNNACGTDTSAAVEVTNHGGVGINELVASTINVWPNPANEYINITSKYPVKAVQLFSAAGQQVEVQAIAGNRINVAELPTGVYFLKVQVEVGGSIHRLVKL